MNERYLFRAKRMDNGEWVEGYYTYYPNGLYAEGMIVHVIRDTSDYPGRLELYSVDPSTICQCTGLKDKNGKLIWENDICIIRDGALDEEDGYFRLDWECERAMFEFEGTGLCVNFDNVYGYECEVVGNIFDNPELLEQED